MSATLDQEIAAELAEMMGEPTLGRRLSEVESAIRTCASRLGVAVPDDWTKGTPAERVRRVQAAMRQLFELANSGAYSMDEETVRDFERQTGALCQLVDELSKRQLPHKPIVKRMASDIPPVVNTNAMSTTFTISTESEDRDGDVIIQKGIKLDKYRLNPVVLFQHGSVLDFPIGTSRSPAGKLSVVRDGNTTQATCYFSKSLAARQVYELVAEGVLSAASINVIPLRSQPRKPGRYLIEESEMLEWSVVDVPANSEAVRKALSRNRLAGRTIEPSLAKSLRLGQVRSLLRERDALLKEFSATLLQLKGNR